MPHVSATAIHDELFAVLAEAESAQYTASTPVHHDTVQRSPHPKSEKASLQALAEMSGEVGRSLFNFAANAVKQAGELTSRFGNEIQVGHRKVHVVREIAEGGFSKVFLVRDGGLSAQMTALKQMLVHTRATIDCCQRTL